MIWLEVLSFNSDKMFVSNSYCNRSILSRIRKIALALRVPFYLLIPAPSIIVNESIYLIPDIFHSLTFFEILNIGRTQGQGHPPFVLTSAVSSLSSSSSSSITPSFFASSNICQNQTHFVIRVKLLLIGHRLYQANLLSVFYY